jgi:antitoxin (DNA-binding transcriptional repressor) of toxin-antitoxin stability system
MMTPRYRIAPSGAATKRLRVIRPVRVASQGVSRSVRASLADRAIVDPVEGVLSMEEQTMVVEIGEPAVADLAVRVETGVRIVLTREGRPVAVVMGMTALKELLRRLALGELESAGREGDDLEAVLEDCRLLLEGN